MTEKEKRELLLGDRRMALESLKDLAKWTAASLLTINGGAVVVILNRGGPEAASVASHFVSGVHSAILAGFVGLVGVYFALERLDVRLGLKEAGPWALRIMTILMWVGFTFSMLMVFRSVYSLGEGIEAQIYSEMAQIEEERKDLLKQLEEAKDKKAGPSASVLEQ